MFTTTLLTEHEHLTFRGAMKLSPSAKGRSRFGVIWPKHVAIS